MIYLVTGGTGFIGSYVVRDLVKQGHEVISYDLPAGASPLLKELVPAESLRKVKLIQGDVKDYTLISNTIKENKVDNIIHLAACMIPECENDVPVAIRSTIVGTNNIFEAAKAFKLKRVTWSDSSSVVGKLGNVLGDKLPEGIYCPGNFYGATKALCEFMASHYNKNFGTDIISVRYWRVYGPGKNTGGGALFTEFIKNFALGNPVTVAGGESRWAYIHVEDASSITIKASQVPATKTKVFDLHDGRSYNGWELAEILKEINPQVKVSVTSGKAQYDFPEVEITAAQRELDYKPRSLKQGLTQFANYFRKQNKLSPF
ncbi:MAG TPA: NAD(P)-dependent oxidoreductase [Dehalococcoidales bacterium]|nr:NAD(P)-dependent oxidoreductase [Dehalococcoidales bacterium]